MKRLLAWFSSFLLVVNAVFAAAPAAVWAQEESPTGLFYFTLPLGGLTPEASEPFYGFRLDRAAEDEDRMAPLSRSFAPGEIELPPLFELRFQDEDVAALNFGGLDTLPMLDGRMSFHGDHAGADTEHYLMIGAGVAGFVLLCIFTFCDDDEGDGGTKD